jgi:hypothetical protein
MVGHFSFLFAPALERPGKTKKCNRTYIDPEDEVSFQSKGLNMKLK